MSIIIKTIVIISDVIAYLILSVGYYYMVQYLFGPKDNPLIHELAEGAAITIIYAFWPVFLSLGLLSNCKCEVPTWLFRVSVIVFILWAFLIVGSLLV